MADERPYLAFEYIEGGTLAHHLAGDPWPSRSAAALVEVLARAVQFAHDRGIVHRDLKPGNVLLAGGSRKKDESTKEESRKATQVLGGVSTLLRLPTDHSSLPTAKITDFGLANRVEKESDWSASGEHVPGAAGGHTRTGAVMGTPSDIWRNRRRKRSRCRPAGGCLCARGNSL